MVTERKFKTFNCNRQILYIAYIFALTVFTYCVITVCICTIADILELGIAFTLTFMMVIILIDYAVKGYVYKRSLYKSVYDTSILTAAIGEIIGFIIGSIGTSGNELVMLIACWAILTYVHIWAYRTSDNLNSVYTVYASDCLSSTLEVRNEKCDE